MVRRFFLALRTVLLRRRLEREMQEEMALHLAQSTERLLARGLTADAARHGARREFGNVAYLQEQARDARGGRWLETMVADLRFGVRHFGRTPFSTLTMIVLLALGIGFNSALFATIYSFVNMTPPGIARAESLVRIRGGERNGAGQTQGREFSYPEYREYEAQRSLFSAVTAWTSSDVVLNVSSGAEGLHSGAATYVSGSYFAVLGVHLVMGAGLPATSVDNDADPQLVAVISHAVWDRHMGGAPDVLGKTIKVNDVAFTIVGVAPRRFAGTRPGGSQVRVWVPLSTRALVQRTNVSLLSSRDSALFGLAARLRPGIEPLQTMPVVQAIAARSAQQTLRARAHSPSTDVVTLLANNYFPPSGRQPDTMGRMSSMLIPLLILLICCTNVSTLLVGLAVARRREIAVRLSLGAARRRVVRQLITESVLLALAAAVFGLVIILILLRVFGARVPDVQMVLPWPAVLFTFGLAIVTGIVFGASPALHATRLAVSEVLKESAAAVVATRSRLQSGLVVAQIALTQPLLLGQGALILEQLKDLQRQPAPLYNDRILQVSFNTNPRYGVQDQMREDILRRLQTRIAALPGVVAVVAQHAQDNYVRVALHPSDRVGGLEDADAFLVSARAAPPGYFELMGFPLVRGRGFTESDLNDSQALVVRGDLARRLWGSTDPIGRRLVHADGGATAFVIVGVVDETRAGLSGDDEQHAFVPRVSRTGSLLVRTQGRADPIIPLIRSVAHAEAPALPVTRVTTLAALDAQQRTLVTRMIGGAAIVGMVALFLCAIGLYAVVSFAVGQRTREIGIRTALGADSQQVVSMFFMRGLRLSGIGLLIGLGLSILVQRIVVVASGNDAEAGLTVLAVLVAAVVVGVATVATWIPARRASIVDPLTALRAE
ncbi:MAG: ABC transporter permease [Longimicrobiales bacterium]